MKREIKYRAKIAGTDIWIYGLPYSVYGNGIDCIQDFESRDIEYIQTNTLGQFTGLKDKNGVEIYDGDIVATKCKDYKYFVVFENGSFVYYHLKIKDGYGNNVRWGTLARASELKEFELEIIGNIHDNPELLK